MAVDCGDERKKKDAQKILYMHCFVILILLRLTSCIPVDVEPSSEPFSIFNRFKSMIFNSGSRSSMDSTASDLSSYHIWSSSDSDDEELISEKNILDLKQDALHEIMKRLDMNDYKNLMMTSRTMRDHVLNFSPAFRLGNEVQAKCMLSNAKMRSFYNGHETNRIYLDVLNDDCLDSINQFCRAHSEGYLPLKHPIRLAAIRSKSIPDLDKLPDCRVDFFMQFYETNRTELGTATRPFRQLTHTNIISFSMHGHRSLSSANVQDIASLFTLPGNQVQELDIGFNSFVNYDVFREFLMSLTSPHSRVDKLELQGTSLKKDVYSDRSKLLGNRGARVIAEFLSTPHNNISSLNLIHLGIDGDGIGDLGASFRSPHNQMKHMDLHANFVTNGDPNGFTDFCRSLSSNIQLESLGISRVALNEKAVAALVNFVLNSPFTKLSELDVRFNRLSTYSIEIISKSLRHTNNSLQYLFMSDKVDNEGCSHIAGALASEQAKLIGLEMQGCGLTARCAGLIAKALDSPHSKLKHLNLHMNQIFSTGISEFIALLNQPTCSLSYLNLSENSVIWYYQLFHDLLRAIGNSNHRLKTLDVAQAISPLSADWKREILDVARPLDLRLRF